MGWRQAQKEEMGTGPIFQVQKLGKGPGIDGQIPKSYVGIGRQGP
jgi:hypothetical protein